MRIEDFDFDLPEEAIALRPVAPRDSARMLEVSPQGLIDHHVRDLPSVLKRGDLLVLNETRVFPAALKAVRKARPHGGGGDVTISVNLHKCESTRVWRAFVKPSKRLRVGDEIFFSDKLSAEVLAKTHGGDVTLSFSHEGQTLLAKFEELGVPPLPPYIAKHREIDSQDIVDYQTVYAVESGSVAAPTAGLHFTPNLLQEIEKKGVEIARLVLHVGAGTFLPVKSDEIDNHHMHTEWFSISEYTAKKINEHKDKGGRVIAVGTTSLRALESAAIDGKIIAQSKETDIFIKPGHKFQIVDGLMTNFHLPRSTLFMLVCALGGINAMQDAYKYAVETGYRFYSYGDSSLIWQNT